MQEHDEPLEEVTFDGSHISLLGTAHVSRASKETVEALLGRGNFDAVAVELCPSRYQAIVDPSALARMDLFRVIRDKRVPMVMASLALGAYQQRLADQFDIEPGAEQKAAIRSAQANGLPVLLIDREIGVTLKRVASNIGWWKRLGLFAGLMAALASREEVSEEEIERLKEGDVLETTFAEFASDRRELFQPLIDERDRYMAARLREEIGQHRHEHVLAVVGAGHLRGIVRYLHEDKSAPGDVMAELDQIPASNPWRKLVPWLIVLLILGGFFYGFLQSPALGWQLIFDWVLINGGLSALGAVLAAAHPITIVTAFLAAPITSLNPTIGAGMVTAAVEIWLRRPNVGDFSRLRHDTSSLHGWWRNRVSRILLVFLLSSLGSALGTYLAGFRIFERLVA